MAKSDKDQVYVAKESGAANVDGVDLVFVRGVTRVRSGHALLKAVPDYFEPADEDVHYDVEQATAAPGKKRGE